ncbi:hypothetical protein [Chitinophaga sp. MM2321]|uniref:hypothetical protein n=1 Tax=Chitinophaga sp. MM2321 TaxID=3137178 RepID=UPI0032D56DD3
MKPNVDIVNLIAIQELADVVAPDINDYLNIGKDEDLLGKRITVNNLAQLISSVLGSGSILPDRVYRIGTSLPSGATLSDDGTVIYDPYLDGKIYQLNRRGIELSIKGVEWDNDVINTDDDVQGGVRLLAPGDMFGDGETVILTFQPQFSPYIPTPDAISRFTNGEQIITSSSTITAGMFRKLIVLSGATSILTVTLPSAAAYPENVALFIISNSGSHRQASIVRTGSDIISYDGQDISTLYMGKNDQLCLIPMEGGWRVQMFKTEWNRIGTIDFGYLAGPNQFVATTDVPQLRSEWPRVWDFIQKLQVAQPAAVVSNATWLLNKGLWGLGNGSTTFNFPNLSGRGLRYLDPSGTIDEDRFDAGQGNLPGSFQGFATQSHNHLTDNKFNRAGARAADVDGTGTPGSVDNTNPNSEYRVGYMSGPGYDWWPNTIIKPFGSSFETRMINVGGLPLINT